MAYIIQSWTYKRGSHHGLWLGVKSLVVSYWSLAQRGSFFLSFFLSFFSRIGFIYRRVRTVVMSYLAFLPSWTWFILQQGDKTFRPMPFLHQKWTFLNKQFSTLAYIKTLEIYLSARESLSIQTSISRSVRNEKAAFMVRDCINYIVWKWLGFLYAAPYKKVQGNRY